MFLKNGVKEKTVVMSAWAVLLTTAVLLVLERESNKQVGFWSQSRPLLLRQAEEKSNNNNTNIYVLLSLSLLPCPKNTDK